MTTFYAFRRSFYFTDHFLYWVMSNNYIRQLDISKILTVFVINHLELYSHSHTHSEGFTINPLFRLRSCIHLLGTAATVFQSVMKKSPELLPWYRLNLFHVGIQKINNRKKCILLSYKDATDVAPIIPSWYLTLSMIHQHVQTCTLVPLFTFVTVSLSSKLHYSSSIIDSSY